MDEDALRRTIESEVGPVSQAIWNFLREEGYTRISHDEDARALMNAARRLVLLAKAPAGTRRRKPSRVRQIASAARPAPEPRLLKDERLRRDVLTRYFASEAARLPDVRHFRADVLGGRTLSAELARRWLESPAARTFPLEEFRRRGVDPARHRSVLVHAGHTPDTYSAVIRIQPGNGEWRFEEAIDDDSAGLLDPLLRDGAFRFVIRAGPDKIEGRARRESLIHLLRRTATKLTLPGYPMDADFKEWFLLTGELPHVLAAENSWYAADRAGHRIAGITIDVAPWISADTLLAAYRDMQQELLKRHNRPMSTRRLTLFGFVTEHTDDEGTVPPWSTLIEAWNRRHRAWKYDDVRNLSRDYWAAARQLLKPDYRLFD